jgi:putative salt-induced outer membrane protein
MKVTLALLAAVVATPLAAQDSIPKRFKVTGDVNFISTGGNTDVLTLGVGDKIEWKAAQRFTVKQDFRWGYAEDDGEQTANQLLLALRGEYALTGRVSLFGAVGYDYNLFAGVKRHFAEDVGLTFLALDHPRDKLRLDAGISFNQEWEVLHDESDNFTAGRLAADYKHFFGEKPYFQQIVEYLPNFTNSSDYRFNTETNLVAPISGGVAVKIGYVLRYRGEPPEGFGSTDTVFRTGIQITN